MKIIESGKLIRADDVRKVYNAIMKYSIWRSTAIQQIVASGSGLHSVYNGQTDFLYIVSTQDGIIFKSDGTAVYKIDPVTPYGSDTGQNFRTEFRYYDLSTESMGTETIQYTSGNTYDTLSLSNRIVIDMRTTNSYVYSNSRVVGLYSGVVPVRLINSTDYGFNLNGTFIATGSGSNSYGFRIYYSDGTTSDVTFNTSSSTGVWTYGLSPSRTVKGFGSLSGYTFPSLNHVRYTAIAPWGYRYANGLTINSTRTTAGSGEVLRLTFTTNGFFAI